MFDPESPNRSRPAASTGAVCRGRVEALAQDAP